MKLKTKPPVGTIVKIEMSGNRYNAFDKDGTKWTHAIITSTRKNTFAANMALECREGKGGRIYWWKVPLSAMGNDKANPIPTPTEIEVPEGHHEVIEFIRDSYKLKPDGLIMNELK